MRYKFLLNISSLPFAFEETCFVQGQNEPCIVIPLKFSGAITTQNGKAYIAFNVFEREDVPHGATHAAEVRITDEKVRNYAYAHKQNIDRNGYLFPFVQFSGKARPYMEKRENPGTDIFLKGTINKTAIEQSGVKMVGTAKSIQCAIKTIDESGTQIYCIGYIMTARVADEYCETSRFDGCKRAQVKLIKRKIVDMYGYTHGMYVMKGDGRWIEIGRFQEYREAENMPKKEEAPQEVDEQPKQQSPDDDIAFIDGLKL
jgi:NDP-sugar pyrophosphorylase family protein